MPIKPTTRDAIHAALREFGPMSSEDISQHLGWDRNRVVTCMSTARGYHPGKFFRIVRYEFQRGRAGREIPIYSATTGPDLPRPVLGDENRKEKQRRYYQNNRARIVAKTRARRGHGGAAANPWLAILPTETRIQIANSQRATATNNARAG